MRQGAKPDSRKDSFHGVSNNYRIGGNRRPRRCQLFQRRFRLPRRCGSWRRRLSWWWRLSRRRVARRRWARSLRASGLGAGMGRRCRSWRGSRWCGRDRRCHLSILLQQRGLRILPVSGLLLARPRRLGIAAGRDPPGAGKSPGRTRRYSLDNPPHGRLDHAPSDHGLAFQMGHDLFRKTRFPFSGSCSRTAHASPPLRLVR